MEQWIDEAEARVRQLLVQHAPQLPSGEPSLSAARNELQPGSRLDNPAVRRYNILVRDIALGELYPENPRLPRAYQPVLFKVSLNRDGALSFNNFITGAFPKLKEPWHAMSAATGEWGTDGAHLQTPNSWAALVELMGHLNVALDAELAELSLRNSRVYRARLLSVRMALVQTRLSGRTQEALPHDLGAWLAADVDLQVLLYAFGMDKNFWERPEQPLIPLADALELEGVPMHNIRSLYPMVS